MPAYCDVDGVPCHASHELLTTILRDEWGFDGVVASDYTAVQMLVGAAPPDRRPRDRRGDGRCGPAWTASCRRPPASAAPLRDALADGRLDAGVVDLAVERMLRLKFRLGLFERPYVEPPTPAALAALEAEERAPGPGPRPALDRARRERRDRCRCAPDVGRIAVIGPIADSARDLLGDYAHLLHIETLAELRHRANPFGFPSSDVINPVDELSAMPTILDGLRDRFGAERIVHAVGTGLRDGTDAELAEAVVVARGADVAIVVVGERSGLTDDATTGESRDRRDLGLLGRQQELLEAVVATGTPTVLVVVSGRPARARVGRRALRRGAPRLGPRRGRAGRRSPRSSRATSTRAAGCRSRCRATSARSR